MKTVGKVYLVGAGPGDTHLLTLRGAELLAQAQVVIHDGLINGDLLRLVPREAEIIYGGKHDRDRAVAQAELNDLLLAKAHEGKRVVRLKGGDPYVFGRGGEEAEVLATAGIPFEVVPGVSSAEAVPNYAGIPVTHRDFCSSYTVVTGHEVPGREASRLGLESPGAVAGTLIVMMGRAQVGQIAEELMRHGRSPDTPAAMIQWGTTGRQKTVAGHFADPGRPGGSRWPDSTRLDRHWGSGSLAGETQLVRTPPVPGATHRGDAAARTGGDPGAFTPRARGGSVGGSYRQRVPTPPTEHWERVWRQMRAYDWLLFSHPFAVQSFFGKTSSGHIPTGANSETPGSPALGAHPRGPRTIAT